MEYWIISANGKKYNHECSFRKNGYIDWRQKYGFEKDDIVYIYCTNPEKRIKYKTIVEKVNMNYAEITDDKEFWNDIEEYNLDKKSERFFRLKLINNVDNASLSLDFLRENGLTGNPQGARRVNNELLKYIEKYI